MQITIERDYDFIPKFQENDKEPTPVVFHMRRLTTAERDKLIDYSVGQNGEVSVHPDRQGLFMRGVKKIDGLMVNGTTISTPKDFLDQPGLNVLFSEVIGNIIAENGQSDLKNS
jgi:hypothetical protein